MCGLVAFYSPSHNPIHAEALARATQALAHRGPDGEGIWLSPRRDVGLGHRRLALMDPEHGAQPMHLANGGAALSLVVNGEFYAIETIQSSLEEKGSRFATRSDSEIVLHLYQQGMLNQLEHLRGEFAFVLYDAANHRLIAARDRFGIKPLCYHVRADGTLLIASEAKALLAAEVVPRWNEQALAHISCLQYAAPDQTLFEGIKQLPAGHMLIADAQGITIRPYWTPPQPSLASRLSKEEFCHQLHDALCEAVGIRLRRDAGKLACHLSGGIDSAAIAGITRALQGVPPTCFTIGFAHPDYDETAVAGRMAQSLGAEHIVVPLSSNQMLEAMPEAVYFSEGLAINGHLGAKYLLNRAVRQAGYAITLSGEGSDELFAGYAHLQADMIGNIAPGLMDASNIAANVHITHRNGLSLDAVEKRFGYVPSFLKAKAAMGLRLRSLMSDEFAANHPAEGIFVPFAAQYPDRFCTTPGERLARSSDLWMRYATTGYILRVLGDGCEMACGVEGRVPCLDHELFTLAQHIPVALKLHEGTEKYIFREAVKPYVTPEIYRRRKQPLMAPPIFTAPGADLTVFWDMIRSSHFQQLGMYDRTRVEALLKKLPEVEAAERPLWESALMLIFTSALFAQAYKV